MVDERPLISLTKIEKGYTLGAAYTKVLHQLCLDIYPKDMLAILGASGSGKSTLMNIIGLLDKTDKGTYLFKGRNIGKESEDALADLRKNSIGFVFQQFNLLPKLTAFQNVELPLIYAGLAKQKRITLVKAVLEQVGMSAFETHKPTELSGGQQQRVAIARALVNNPEVILADEPTGALDSKTGQDIMALFKLLNENGRTIIIITHDSNIASLCSRRVYLEDGEFRPEAVQ